jgi:hypothetical protein
VPSGLKSTFTATPPDGDQAGNPVLLRGGTCEEDVEKKNSLHRQGLATAQVCAVNILYGKLGFKSLWILPNILSLLSWGWKHQAEGPEQAILPILLRLLLSFAIGSVIQYHPDVDLLPERRA